MSVREHILAALAARPGATNPEILSHAKGAITAEQLHNALGPLLAEGKIRASGMREGFKTYALANEDAIPSFIEARPTPPTGVAPMKRKPGRPKGSTSKPEAKRPYTRRAAAEPQHKVADPVALAYRAEASAAAAMADYVARIRGEDPILDHLVNQHRQCRELREVLEAA